MACLPARERHMETEKELIGWEQWWQGTRHSLKRLREEGGHLLMALQLWRTDIHVIEGESCSPPMCAHRPAGGALSLMPPLSAL